MRLTLNHCGNPDASPARRRGGYYAGPPECPAVQDIEVRDLHHAREEFIHWRDSNELGSGNLALGAGNVTGDDGQLVGHFSYNGRFWLPDGSEGKVE